MRRRVALPALLAVLVFVAAAPDPNVPPTSAQRVAGRWRITLQGLDREHTDIFASLAVDGDLLVGTLSVSRESVNISSGKVVGIDLAFAFRHRGDDLVKMTGAATARGLQGTWESREGRGSWRAVRLK